MTTVSKEKSTPRKYLPGLISVFVGACGILLAFSSGPPLERTGDFGEPTCVECHSGNALNAAGGNFTISGTPQGYQPGQTYPITVALSKSGQLRWGFELAARVESTGSQAGMLVSTDGSTFVRSSGNGVQYITHTSNGTSAGNAQGRTWTFNWVAPAQNVGSIRFSAAGNAANNNLVPTGDFIYTTSAVSSPAPQQSFPITAIFAQVAVGGGYITTFSFLNTGADAVIGKLVFTQSDGTPFESAITVSGDPRQSGPGNPVVASSIDLNLMPGGSRFLTASAVNAADSTRVGWARVESSGGILSGVATFRLSSGSSLQTVAGVLAGEKAEAVTIPVNDDGLQGRYTGYALANPEDTPVNITIRLLDGDGNIVRTLQPSDLNPLPPGKHIARFFWQEINDQNFKFQGSIVLTTADGRQFAAVALVQDQGLFTAIPVVRGKPPGISN